jgi:hypothetical protein
LRLSRRLLPSSESLANGGEGVILICMLSLELIR